MSACWLRCDPPARRCSQPRPRFSRVTSVAIFGLGGSGRLRFQRGTPGAQGGVASSSIDTQSSEVSSCSRTFGATECLTRRTSTSRFHEVLIEMTGWLVSIQHLRVHRHTVNVIALGPLDSSTSWGWGRRSSSAWLGAGKKFRTRPVPVDSRSHLEGLGFRLGVKGRTQLPEHGGGRNERARVISPPFRHPTPWASDDINKAFDLMHRARSIRTVIPLLIRPLPIQRQPQGNLIMSICLHFLAMGIFRTSLSGAPDLQEVVAVLRRRSGLLLASRTLGPFKQTDGYFIVAKKPLFNHRPPGQW